MGCIISLAGVSQTAKTQVVMVSAVANSNGSITLTWPAETYAGTFQIYKRVSQENEIWGSQPIANIGGDKNSYTDNTTQIGEAFEYMVLKTLDGNTDALGYIFAGNNWPEPRQFQGIILLIDSNYISPLNSEINQLVSDLEKESWVVYKLFAGRGESVQTVKSRISGLNQTVLIKPSSIFIIGHVPVPYSGFYSSTGSAPPPDGHVEGSGNHTGAWPADVYYGILDNVFTDTDVDCTTGASSRNHNTVGDGKFDQTKLPAKATLEVGRVDLFNMPAFGKSDTLLVKNYLVRNHQWRTGAWKVEEKALIDNNFSTLNLASTGYANLSALLGASQLVDNQDYFTAQKKSGYLWSYGCGAGSYTSCSGIGTTTSFVNDSFQNVFTILAGSFFGDWDNQNNFLRAPLASKSLASFWGGLPKWYVHHMGLGERIGKGTLITQNNASFYYSGNFNASYNSLHIALMGDPSLRMRNLPAVESLTAVSQNKEVKLNWPKLSDPNLAYAIYIVDPITNTYHRLNETPTTDNFYTDKTNFYTGKYTYAVKAIQLETTGSGTFYNTGGAAFADVNHVNGLANLSGNDLLSVYPNPVKSTDGLNLRISNLVQTELLLKLIDINGRELVQQKLSNFNEQGIYLNLSSYQLNAGLYILSIETPTQKYIRKILVQD